MPDKSRPTFLGDGLLLIDKQAEQTSFDVVRDIKRLFNVKKVGHTGTLDPIATGVLPICIGRATKLSSIIMSYTKEYDVWTRFGEATDTHDRTGSTIDEKPWQHINEAALGEAMQTFCGDIKQVPPMFSAIKYKGRPLYWYAHKGIHFANRKERDCTIYKFELLEWQPPRARFLIRCSQGTYVRTLVHDLGKHLESAALVDDLRRTACGAFHASNTVCVSELKELDFALRCKKILTLNEALPDLPDLQVNGVLAKRIRTGRTIMWSDIEHVNPQAKQTGRDAFTSGDYFKLTDPSGDLIAVASLSNTPYIEAHVSQSANRVVRTHRVFSV